MRWAGRAGNDVCQAAHCTNAAAQRAPSHPATHQPTHPGAHTCTHSCAHARMHARAPCGTSQTTPRPTAPARCAQTRGASPAGRPAARPGGALQGGGGGVSMCARVCEPARREWEGRRRPAAPTSAHTHAHAPGAMVMARSWASTSSMYERMASGTTGKCSCSSLGGSSGRLGGWVMRCRARGQPARQQKQHERARHPPQPHELVMLPRLRSRSERIANIISATSPRARTRRRYASRSCVRASVWSRGASLHGVSLHGVSLHARTHTRTHAQPGRHARTCSSRLS